MTITDSKQSPPTDDEFDRLRDQVLARIDIRARKRTRRHRLVAAAAAGIVVLGTTAGALVIAAAPQGQINYTADCYAAADMSSQHGTSDYLPGNQADTTPTPLAERIQLATEQCAATWSVGTFAKPGASAPYTVPQLVACQLPDERLAVFPSVSSVDATCSALGLSTPHE